MSARLSIVALLLIACASESTIVSLSPPTQELHPKGYVDQVKRWTRHGDMRSDFDATMIIDATMHSPEFRAAYVAKYLEVYKVTDSARLEVTSSIPSSPDDYVFHVETQTHTYEINELKPPKSIWRLSLIDDRGREVSVHEVMLERSRAELLQVFYPYTQLFSRPWRVSFPRKLPDGSPLVTPETRSLTFRIAGPAGAIDLSWQLK